MKREVQPTAEFNIYMAGDLACAEQLCREYCLEVGLCVTVSPTNFIYTGGQEGGVIVGVRNYPRFPVSPEDLAITAENLALALIKRCCQQSAMIVGPTDTVWLSRRPEGK